MGAFAWVTMVTNDSYSLGALVLAHSLRRVATQADLAVLVTPGVTPSMREKLAAVYNVVREVNVLDSQDETNLSVLKRPELGITFTKLHCWRLTQYEKCVFLDADTLVVRNCDELFEREELSAARDVGWPDCFNSGVFVFKPSEQTFASITAFAVSQGSFDGADQGLLNSYFSDWGYKDMSKHLPFIYNMCSIATYSYPPAFKQFGANVKIIHFIGATKPWVQYFDTMTGIVQTPAGCEHLHPLLQLWWNIFCENVHPQLTDVMATSNMTTNWHYSDSFPIHLNTSGHVDCKPFDDTNSEINASPPDFSEFNDPWENYSGHTEVSVTNVTQKFNDDKQYLSETGTNVIEQSQTVPHNQCNAEPPPSPSPTLPPYRNEGCQNENTPYSCQISQTSQSQNFTVAPITNYESPSVSYTNPSITDQQYAVTQSEDGADSLAENLSQLSTFCDIIEVMYSVSEDNNQCVNQSERVNNSISKTNMSTVNKNGEILYNKRQSRDENHYYNPHPTDCQNPKSLNPNNIATQSELSAAPCIKSKDGGLAGALSKLTMGEYRTEEQRAIEDHMRKQNWEQGQIDFMGRDSFDNILKKINETLSTVPPVEESPVKETRQPKKTSGQSSKVEATVGESETSLPVLETEDQLKLYTTQELSEDKCQNISEDASSLIKYEQPITISSAISEVDNTSREKILASSQNILEEPEKSVPIAQSSDVPKNTAQESTESKTVLSEMNQDFQLTKTEESEVDKTQSKIDETIEKLVISADTTASILSGLPETEKIEVTSPTQETKPQIVSEATTECPVPIQVAESVLQAEPKESVSEDPRPIIEAVASSIIPSLQESATTISEALIQPDQNVSLEQLSQPQQINGHDPSLELYAEKNVSPAVNESLIICPNISSAVHESVVSQQQDNQSSIQQTLSESENKLQDLESGSAQSTDISLEKPELSTEKPKLTVVLPQTETTINKSSTTEPKLTVVLPQTETTINKSSTTEPTQVIQSEPSTDIEPVAADSGAIPVLLTKEPPVRPIRSKDLKIPGTPTVTEPTPPTSPPVETGTTTVIEEKPQKETQQATEASIEIKIEVESTEKSEAQSQKPLESQQTAKKEQELAKKSSIESDTPSSPESEGSAKKVVKKKKVKKPEESGDSESSSSPGKPKKGTKTGKKLAKIPSTSLETDTTVPETSPPSQSSDAPVPPKRKSKSSSSTKVIDKKSDEPTKQ